MKQKTVFIIALAALLLAFIIGALVYTANKETQTSRLPDAKLAALGRLHSPILGKFDAPVVIVEFLDPACGTCAAFYPLVKDIMAANPGKIRLVLRYAPFHPGSDKVVAVLEAARKQGKFWPALEALLKTQEQWAPNHTAQVDLVWKPLESVGLDLERVRADMLAPEVSRVISQDIEDAKTLNVKQTPEYFVNGKPMPSFGEAQLRRLIDDALAETNRR
jgi:protein-disulfide isomerase